MDYDMNYAYPEIIRKGVMSREVWINPDITPEDKADMFFSHLQHNYQKLSGEGITQTEYFRVQFVSWLEKQHEYSDNKTGWNYRFYTQLLRHRD